jgi:hypothetical protein
VRLQPYRDQGRGGHVAEVSRGRLDRPFRVNGDHFAAGVTPPGPGARADGRPRALHRVLPRNTSRPAPFTSNWCAPMWSATCWAGSHSGSPSPSACGTRDVVGDRLADHLVDCWTAGRSSLRRALAEICSLGDGWCRTTDTPCCAGTDNRDHEAVRGPPRCRRQLDVHRPVNQPGPDGITRIAVCSGHVIVCPPVSRRAAPRGVRCVTGRRPLTTSHASGAPDRTESIAT